MHKFYNCTLAICVCFSLQAAVRMAYAAENAKSEKIETIEIKGAKGVIASQKTSSDILHQCSRPVPDSKKVSKYWVPSKQQLEILENHLPEYLKRQKHISRDLSQYRRIYAGITYNNRKVIYVDFAYMYDHSSDWTTQLAGLCDGGDLFFGVEFDVESRTFSHLYFNGVA